MAFNASGRCFFFNKYTYIHISELMCFYPTTKNRRKALRAKKGRKENALQNICDSI